MAALCHVWNTWTVNALTGLTTSRQTITSTRHNLMIVTQSTGHEFARSGGLPKRWSKTTIIDQSYLAMNQMGDRMDQQRTDTQDLLDLTQHHQSDLNKLYMKQQMYFWRGNQGTKRHCGTELAIRSEHRHI